MPALHCDAFLLRNPSQSLLWSAAASPLSGACHVLSQVSALLQYQWATLRRAASGAAGAPESPGDAAARAAAESAAAAAAAQVAPTVEDSARGPSFLCGSVGKPCGRGAGVAGGECAARCEGCEAASSDSEESYESTGRGASARGEPLVAPCCAGGCGAACECRPCCVAGRGSCESDDPGACSPSGASSASPTASQRSSRASVGQGRGAERAGVRASERVRTFLRCGWF